MTETTSAYLKHICSVLHDGHLPAHGGRVIAANKNFSMEEYNDFAIYLKKKGLKDRTVKAYLFNLHKFNAKITPKTIQQFEQHIYQPFDIKPTSKVTILRRNYFVRRSLALFLAYAGKHALIDTMNEYTNPKAGQHDKTFSERRLKKLLEVADSQTALYMKVAYYSGLRNQELLLIEAKHLNRDRKYALITKDISKSSKEGKAWMPAVVFDELCAFIDRKPAKELKKREHDYIFNFLERGDHSRQRKTLDHLEQEQVRISKLIKKASVESNILLELHNDRPVTPHSFKHCYAKYIEKKGFPMRVRQQLMRLSSSELVDRYSHSGEKEVEAMWKSKDV